MFTWPPKLPWSPRWTSCCVQIVHWDLAACNILIRESSILKVFGFRLPRPHDKSSQYARRSHQHNKLKCTKVALWLHRHRPEQCKEFPRGYEGHPVWQIAMPTANQGRLRHLLSTHAIKLPRHAILSCCPEVFTSLWAAGWVCFSQFLLLQHLCSSCLYSNFLTRRFCLCALADHSKSIIRNFRSQPANDRISKHHPSNVAVHELKGIAASLVKQGLIL